MRVILASASPRRKELLGLLFPEFEVVPALGEEKWEEGPPEEVVRSLARQKAKEVSARLRLPYALNQEALVISADTVVSIDGRILGKPSDEEDAKVMLRLLSGRTHQVYTGVTLLYFGKESSMRSGSGSNEGLTKNDAAESAGHENIDGMIRVNLNGDINQEKTFYVCTDVTFCEMTEREIEAYIATNEPMDKAGGYGIQGYAARFISGIRGDYQNVVGLPVAAIYRELCTGYFCTAP